MLGKAPKNDCGRPREGFDGKKFVEELPAASHLLKGVGRWGHRLAAEKSGSEYHSYIGVSLGKRHVREGKRELFSS